MQAIERFLRYGESSKNKIAEAVTGDLFRVAAAFFNKSQIEVKLCKITKNFTVLTNSMNFRPKIRKYLST